MTSKFDGDQVTEGCLRVMDRPDREDPDEASDQVVDSAQGWEFAGKFWKERPES